jgi:hypothetical protein
MALAHACLGKAAFSSGDLESARSHLRTGVLLCQEFGDRRGIAECLESSAMLAASQGRINNAARLMGHATSLREAIGCPVPPSDRDAYMKFVEMIRAGAGEEHFNAGKTMMIDEAIKLALTD